MPQDGERVMQKNEGDWEFSLEESCDGRAIELSVAVGRFLDTSLIRADVQPHCVRLLIKACSAAPVAKPCARSLHWGQQRCVLRTLPPAAGLSAAITPAPGGQARPEHCTEVGHQRASAAEHAEGDFPQVPGGHVVLPVSWGTCNA